MASIHDSSLGYLVDLANSLDHLMATNQLHKKIESAQKLGKIDLQTVELIEKTVVFLCQAHADVPNALNPQVASLCQKSGIEVKTCDELLCSIEQKLIPLLEQAKLLKGKGVKGATFSERISKAVLDQLPLMDSFDQFFLVLARNA